MCVITYLAGLGENRMNSPKSSKISVKIIKLYYFIFLVSALYFISGCEVYTRKMEIKEAQDINRLSNAHIALESHSIPINSRNINYSFFEHSIDSTNNGYDFIFIPVNDLKITTFEISIFEIVDNKIITPTRLRSVDRSNGKLMTVTREVEFHDRRTNMKVHERFSGDLATILKKFGKNEQPTIHVFYIDAYEFIRLNTKKIKILIRLVIPDSDLENHKKHSRISENNTKSKLNIGELIVQHTGL